MLGCIPLRRSRRGLIARELNGAGVCPGTLARRDAGQGRLGQLRGLAFAAPGILRIELR